MSHSIVKFWLRNGLKLQYKAEQSKFLVFVNHPCRMLLCVVSELAGGGSVDVAVSDMGQVTGDMQHLTPDT